MNGRAQGGMVGLAFIVEGATEKVFYSEYLADLCARAGYAFVKDVTSQEDLYVIEMRAAGAGGESVTGGAAGASDTFGALSEGNGQAIVMFWSSNSVSNIASGSVWFRRACAEAFPQVSWTVFLCYDTDEYNARITRFYEGDREQLRADVAGCAAGVVDMAAEADIEDIILCDLAGVLRFLGLPADTQVPPGNKGKTKLKKLYRMVASNHAYHSGGKARALIQALDMECLRRVAPVPLGEIDKALGGGRDCGRDGGRGGGSDCGHM
jgi:hypothetical protein